MKNWKVIKYFLPAIWLALISLLMALLKSDLFLFAMIGSWVCLFLASKKADHFYQQKANQL
ncbi:putative ABC transporter permease protein [Bacillus sp. TS-2]|nr:putative ABC transporter permease protein [Bacillus sp. TS-2]